MLYLHSGYTRYTRYSRYTGHRSRSESQESVARRHSGITATSATLQHVSRAVAGMEPPQLPGPGLAPVLTITLAAVTSLAPRP